MKFTRSILLSTICFVLISTVSLKAQTTDSIHIIKNIYPFEITGNPAINMPLISPTALGDINGDGKTDFIFREYAADERTDEPFDLVRKSIIVTDINNPDDALVFYEGDFQGIKDYNGDGYDDMLNIENKTIYFGVADCISDDSLVIDFPDDFRNIYFADDITGDGKADFILGDAAPEKLLFSSDMNGPIEFSAPYGLFENSTGHYFYYDYDGDGVKELGISNHSPNYLSDEVAWYIADTLSQEMIREERSLVPFSGRFTDLNADGIPDIVREYLMEGEYHISALFGTNTSPYFEEEPRVFSTGHEVRIFYAGDLNNDGYDDWYSKTHADTIILFKGNENLIDSGFYSQKFYTGGNSLMLPINSNVNTFHTLLQAPVFFYDEDSIPDLFLRYWSFDDNLQFEKVGTAIIKGGSSPDFTNPLLLTQPNERAYEARSYGHEVKNIGDMNKDGYPDFGILADEGNYLEIFFGGEDPGNEPDIKIMLPRTGRNNALDWDAGDINNDGFTDIIIGNSSENDHYYHLNHMMPFMSRVLVFMGKEDIPSLLNYTDADYVIDETDDFYEFGKNIQIIGDYNADGYNDFLIGGYMQRSRITKAYLYFGGPEIQDEPGMIFYGFYSSSPSSEENIFTRCGDINADNYDDFIIYDPLQPKGRYLVYFGGPDADNLHDMVINNPDNNNENVFKVAVEECRDFNGDGHPDFMFSSTDTIYLYHGGPEMDSIHDVIYPNTASLHTLDVEFVPGLTTAGKTDILSIGRGGISVFTADDTITNQAEMLLSTDMRGATNACTGDFNMDGYMELIIGFPREQNYGLYKGGIAKIFRFPVYTDQEEHLALKNKALVYPNPAHDFIDISLPGAENADLHIRLYSIDGREVMESRESRINIQHLPEGMYFLHLKTSELPVEVHKVLVQ